MAVTFWNYRSGLDSKVKVLKCSDFTKCKLSSKSNEYPVKVIDSKYIHNALTVKVGEGSGPL